MFWVPLLLSFLLMEYTLGTQIPYPTSPCLCLCQVLSVKSVCDTWELVIKWLPLNSGLLKFLLG